MIKMDFITILALIAFGSLLFPPKDGEYDPNETVETAPTIALTPVYDSGIVDPKQPNLGGMMVGTESILRIYKTPTKSEVEEMVNVPSWAISNSLDVGTYFFTILDSNKEWSWKLDYHYATKLVNGKTTIIKSGKSYDDVEMNLLAEMQNIITVYRQRLVDTTGDGGVPANGDDDTGDGGTSDAPPSGGIGGGFGTFQQDTVLPTKTKKKEVLEDVFIVKDNGTVIGEDVNIGGSPYAGL